MKKFETITLYYFDKKYLEMVIKTVVKKLNYALNMKKNKMA